MKAILRTLVATGMAMTSLAASAQAVRLNADSYTDTPALPFARPPAQPGDAAKAATASFPAGYVLRTGELISSDLAIWAQREGWEFFWQPTVSWRTVRGAQFPQTDIAAAVTEVVNILRDEGKPVRLRIFEGNKVMEVISTEVRND